MLKFVTKYFAFIKRHFLSVFRILIATFAPTNVATCRVRSSHYYIYYRHD